MYTCEKCKKGFRDRYNLSKHMSRIKPCSSQIISMEPKNFEIDKQDSGFDKQDSGFDKQDSGFGKQDSGFDKQDSGIKNRCKFCLNDFFNTQSRKRHEATCKDRNDTRLLELELDVKPKITECKTECRFCNKKFFRTDSLKEHIPICKEREIYHDKLLNTKKEQQMVITNIHNGNNINNIQVINNYFSENTIPFGKPRLTGHIITEKFVEILRESYKQYGQGQDYEVAGEILLRLEECIQEIPENRNYLADQKSPIWTVKTEEGTKSMDKDKCIHSIIKENAGILCENKDSINEHNQQVFKNKTMVDSFVHQKTFQKKGINHKPYGEKKINKIKNGLQIINKNVVCDF